MHVKGWRTCPDTKWHRDIRNFQNLDASREPRNPYFTSIPFTSRWSSMAMTRQRLPSISRVSTRSERSGFTFMMISGVSIWNVLALAILDARSVLCSPTVYSYSLSKYSSFSSDTPLLDKSFLTSGLDNSSGSGSSLDSSSISFRLSWMLRTTS